MVGWHHQLNGHGFEQALGDGEGQGSLVCCSPWGHTDLEKTLEIPLDSKEIKLVNPKGNEHQIFIGRTDAEAETPVLWPPDVKNRLI